MKTHYEGALANFGVIVALDEEFVAVDLRRSVIFFS
jgi:hypothetical protein